MSKLIGSIACNHAGRSRLTRRILAMMLSFAMVMSNMSVYAAEATTEVATDVETEETTEVETETNEDADDEGGEDSAFADAFADNSATISSYNTAPMSSAETYTFTASTALESLDKSTSIDEGTEYADGYFWTVGSTKRANSSTYALEISSNLAGALAFRIADGYTATVTASVCSTGGTNTSDGGFLYLHTDDDDAAATEANGTESVTGTSGDTVTYYNLTAGTYWFATKGTSRGYRLMSASVKLTATGDAEVETTDWPDIKDPVIDNAEQVKNEDDSLTTSIKVSLSDAAIDSTDTLTVNMYSSDQVEGGALIDDATATVSKTLSASNVVVDEEEGTASASVTFMGVSASDTYYFQAVKSRTDCDDKTSELKSAKFILPLSTPTISSASFKETVTDDDGNETGTITVKWNAVDEADYYVIALEYTDDTNSETSIDSVTYTPGDDESDATAFEKEITGLIMESTVSVTVTAYRSEGAESYDVSETSSAKEVSVTESQNPVYTVDVTGGLVTTETYGGEDDILTFTVLEDMPYKSDGEYVQGTTNPSPNKGSIPTSGAAFKIIATKSAEITFDSYFNGNKTYYFVNESGTYETVSGSVDGSTTPVTESLTFTLHAGETYYFYVTGSKVMVQGISYTKVYVDEIDITEGLVTGTTYGDEDLVTFTVLEDMPYKSDGEYVQGSTNPSPNKGSIPTSGAAFEIVAVTSAEITFDSYFNGNKTYYFVNKSGTYDTISGTVDGSTTPVTETLSFTLHAGETYYFYVTGSKVMVQGIYLAEWYTADDEADEDRGTWSNVADPEIVSAVQDGSKITVVAKGVINKTGEGADYLTVGMYDEADIDLDDPQATSTVTSTTNTTADADGNHLTTVTFTPSASGNYAFKAFLGRDDETDDDGNVTATYSVKDSEFSDVMTYRVPLSTPAISTISNLDADENGDGGLSVTWKKITDADYYIVIVADADGNTLQSAQIEGASAEFTGLSISSTVYVTVQAVRENDDETVDYSDVSDSKELTITGSAPYIYTFDGEDYVDSVTGTSESAGSKYGTSDYFTLTLSDSSDAAATFKTASTGTYLELSKKETSGMKFTVYGTADATFTVASTGSSNHSVFALMNSSGEYMAAKSTTGSEYTAISNVYDIYGTTTSTIEYSDLPADTYTFVSPEQSDYNRGGRLHSITVYDSDDMAERGTWSDVSVPEITKISYVKGESTISVTANGYIGYNGADSLMVEMIASDGTVMETVYKASESTVDGDTITNVDQEFTFTPTASDDYSFKASLVRSGSDNIEMTDSTDDWTVEDFVLPLAKPSVSSMTNVSYGDADDDYGSLEVIFAGVDEADYYVVAAFSNNTFNSSDSYVDIEALALVEGTTDESGNTVTYGLLGTATDADQAYTAMLEGLTLGECYITVQAFRYTDSSRNSLNMAAETTTITKTTDAESGETNIIKDVSYTLDLAKAALTDEEAEVSLDTAVSENDSEARLAIGVIRSQVPDGTEKYINGKDDTRWYHSVYGSNTSRATYTRAAGLNAFDGEYDGSTSATVPANGYYETVYTEGDNKGDLESVTLWSENGRGKIVPASVDGLSYYYTAIDPSQSNFTLSALIKVKSWQYSNGQDGFGMMVSDTVGTDGDDGDAWTNAYQLIASKMQYSWVRASASDTGVGYVTDSSGNGTTIMRYEMKLGLGWNSKEGATASDVAKIKAGTLTTPANFTTDSGTFETSAGNSDLYTGTYNIIGNGYNSNAIPTSSGDLLTDFRMQIQKYDNAYVLRYLAVDATSADTVTALLTSAETDGRAYSESTNGDIVNIDTDGDNEYDAEYVLISGSWYEALAEQVFSDDNNNNLTQIDKNTVYVGFIAARYARINISQIVLETPAAGEEYEIPTTYVDPSAEFTSEEAANSSDYDLVFKSNFDGTLTIMKGTDKDNITEIVTAGKAISANTSYTFTTEVSDGENYFVYYAQPSTTYVPGENQVLSNFNMQTNESAPFTVSYGAFAGDAIYVIPNGAAYGTYTTDSDGNTYYAGSKENPTNVYDAVAYAQAGQTIYLAPCEYKLATDDAHGDGSASANLLIGRGHDGTARAYITMTAWSDYDGDLEESYYGRPVLNFEQKTQQNTTAFIIAGNYWYLEGFDVTGSMDGQKGIQLSGSYNILSDLKTYLNGNTGVQIARYLGSDSKSLWPAYNTVLNCTSFMNYDAGYEDADGFAAKLTCGDGNVFQGCISAYNADDGWDLFAKLESGAIGSVTIKNCLAFKNGYLFGKEDYYGDGQDLIYRDLTFAKYTKNTSLVSAGNGNGFKMGGDSISGYHTLINSVAFGNKSKGIDSNSCPDIQLYNSISFNNEANNVAMYTGGAVNTDYYAENIISVKDSNCEDGYSTAENISPVGNQSTGKIYSSSNYYWSGSKSVNSDSDVFDIDWFSKTNISTAIFGSKSSTAPAVFTGSAGTGGIYRESNGSINLNGFLELTEEGLAALGRDSSSVVGSTDKNDVIDTVIDLYVYAADYSASTATLSSIDLSKFDATSKLTEEANGAYEWDEPDTLLAAYAGTTAEFTISPTNSNATLTRTVAVNFIQLNGAELQIVSGDTDGDEVLDIDETWYVEAVPVISPAVEPDVAMSGFSATVTNGSTSLITLGTAETGTVNANLNVLTARASVTNSSALNGDAKLTATVMLTTAGNKTVKQTATLAFAVKNGENIKFDSITDKNGAEATSTSDTVRWNSESDDDYIRVSMDEMTGSTFTLKNLHLTNADGTTKSFGRGVSIKVNDTSVIKLASQTTSADGVDAAFTVVNKSGDGGTATITVTSKDDKSLTRSYIVTVAGSDFAWNAGTIEIDKAKTAGVQLTALAPFDRTMSGVSDITVAAAYKGTKASGTTVSSDYFTVSKSTGSIYELNTTESAVSGLAKGTYTVVYQATVTTTTEETTTTETVAFTPITIKVVETKPTVTFKQTKKVNLFYKKGTDGSTGALTLSSKQGAVTLVSDNSYVDSAGGYYRLTGDSSGYSIVLRNDPIDEVKSYGSAKIKAAAKTDAKMTLTAHVDGYYDAYDVTKTITIGTEYKQPKLKLTAIDTTVYTAIGMTGADILIYDPDSEMYLGADYVTLVDTQPTDSKEKKAYSKANADFTVGDITSSTNSGNGVKLTINDTTVKGGTVKLKVYYDDWNSYDAVIVSQSVKVTDKVPKFTIEAAKLNIGSAFVGKEQAVSTIKLNGASGYDISSFTLSSNKAAAQEFLDTYVDYEVGTDSDGNNVLYVNLKTNSDGAFPSALASNGVYKMNSGYASSYSYTATYTLGSSTTPLTTTFRIALVSKETVNVTASGSLDIVDRDNSTVSLKLKTQNFTASQVTNVTLTGDAANMFEIVEYDRSTGLTTIKAKETADLKKGSYRIVPVYTFDLGVSGTCTMSPVKPVTIRTKQSTLSISGLKDALEVKLSSPSTAAQRTITVSKPSGAYITGMTQTSQTANFALSYDAGGSTISVTIKDRAGLKEGTTYKITATLTVEGSGTNVKQQVITIPVKVLR